MPFAEELPPFFDTGDFGTAATFTHVGGAPVLVNGLFDASFDDPLGIEGTFPRFACAVADVPRVAHGDGLVIGPATYKVVGVKPDGTGIVILTLQEQ